MGIWKKFFAKSGSFALHGQSLNMDAPLTACEVKGVLDEIIECRRTYEATTTEKVEQQVAMGVKVLSAQFDLLLNKVSNRDDVELVLACFRDALTFRADGRRKPSHIEGRIIWVAGVECKGLQRIMAEKLGILGDPWLNALSQELDAAAKAALDGEQLALKIFEAMVNFLLLTNSTQSQAALRDALSRYNSSQLMKLDPFEHIREAIRKGRTTLTGSWDDHWHMR